MTSTRSAEGRRGRHRAPGSGFGPASGYGTSEVAGWLGLPATTLRSWARGGLLAAERRDGRYRFTFEDLSVLRAARHLLAQGLAPRRVRGALASLRDRLSGDRPLSSYRLELEAGRVIVREAGVRWEVGSGQRLLDLEPTSASGAGVAAAFPADASGTLGAAEPACGGSPESREEGDAAELLGRARRVELDDPDLAARLYRAALDRDPRLADAHVNLGRLLHEDGDVAGAEAHYRAAIAARPQDATAHYNLGVALEDRGDAVAARAAYGRALELDPESAEAHFNLAGVLERQGRGAEAVGHLKTYRGLVRRRS